jgi:putative inorganic carbon (hco3(-)) transporter
LLAFLYILFGGIRGLRRDFVSDFSKSPPGIAVLGLFIVTLLSYFSAIDPIESVLETARYFTLVSAAILVSVMVAHDLRSLRVLVVATLLLLVLDGLIVWKGLRAFIAGEFGSISDIKFVYSNKNIYAASLFVKIPAALYAMLYERGWIRKLSVVALFVGVTALLILSSRTFYVGLVVASVFLSVYVLSCVVIRRESAHLRTLAIFFAVLATSVGLFSAVQRGFYPSDGAREAFSVGARFGSVASTGDASNRARLDAWRWSLDLIRAQPVLGVGAGNWRIAALAHENQVSSHYNYMYRAHNDFIETTADRGLLGGAFYLGIFLSVLALAIRGFRPRGDLDGSADPVHRGLFLAAAGVVFYAVDAFFNFPGDRAEMSTALGLFVGIAVAAAHVQFQESGGPPSSDRRAGSGFNPPGSRGEGFLRGLFAVMMLVSIAVLYLGVVSSRTQGRVYAGITAERFDGTADELTAGFPRIPSLSHYAESISTLKGRLLMNEARYAEAIEVMVQDTRHPFDGRREAFIAESYLRLDMPERAWPFVLRARELKPLFWGSVNTQVAILEADQRVDEILVVLLDFIERMPDNPYSRIALASTRVNLGDLEGALDEMNEALERFPGVSEVEAHHEVVRGVILKQTYAPILEEALRWYGAGDYARALPYFNDYLAGVPDDPVVLEQRAGSLYLLGQYENSLNDLERLRELGHWAGPLMNLRGANFERMGDLARACLDFEAAIAVGDSLGRQNYTRYCEGRREG